MLWFVEQAHLCKQAVEEFTTVSLKTIDNISLIKKHLELGYLTKTWRHKKIYMFFNIVAMLSMSIISFALSSCV